MEEAAYIRAIVRTDLAEIGYLPKDVVAPRPGQAPPPDWHVYQAALRWCAAAPCTETLPRA
jgi:hypothetical protein